MEYIEMTGKTVEEATQKALKILDAQPENVSVEVVDSGAKGFFLGIGQKPAKVIVKLNFDPGRLAKKFLRDVTDAMGLSIAIDAEHSGKTLSIELKGQNLGVLIGKHGQTLDSLQYLTNLAINKNKENYVNVQIDTEGYREKRKETLEILARNMAKKARQTKRAVRLEPMSPAERRVIHAALQGERQISTFSEGQDPYRNVVISFKRDHSYSKKETGGKEGSYRDSSYKKEGRSYYSGDKSFSKPGQRTFNKTSAGKFITMDGSADSVDVSESSSE